MTTLTQREAVAAAKVYKATQPAIDALRETISANESAKKILGEYMVANELDTFRGIGLKLVEFTGWDDAKLRAHLGEKVPEFRTKRKRKHFSLLRRRRPASAG